MCIMYVYFGSQFNRKPHFHLAPLNNLLEGISIMILSVLHSLQTKST